jgi:hypothetical protein
LEAKLINLALTAKNFEASGPFGPAWEKDPGGFFGFLYVVRIRHRGFFEI